MSKKRLLLLTFALVVVLLAVLGGRFSGQIEQWLLAMHGH